MTQRYLINAVVGTLAERPPANNPTGGATESPYGLYVDTDTGDIYETTGSAWVNIGTLAGNGATSISGLVTDAADGIAVTGNVDAASFTQGGQSLETVIDSAANTFTVGPQTFQSDDPGHIAVIEEAAAGQAANIHEFRDSTGQVLVEIDAHGNIVAVALTPPAAPTKGAKTTGDITGTGYQWACTLVNAQGETTLGTKSGATALTAQQQSLTMPATCPDGCTFNLYRNKTSGSTWRQVTTGLVAGAVYVDDALDVALGSTAPGANTTAPAIGGLPGLTADGQTPPGVEIAGNLSVGSTDPDTAYIQLANGEFFTHPGGGISVVKSDDNHLCLEMKCPAGSSGGEVALVNSDGLAVWQVSINGSAVQTGGIGVFAQAAPSSQAVLATGADHTLDDVIALLQSYGFCKQS